MGQTGYSKTPFSQSAEVLFFHHVVTSSVHEVGDLLAYSTWPIKDKTTEPKILHAKISWELCFVSKNN